MQVSLLRERDCFLVAVVVAVGTRLNPHLTRGMVDTLPGVRLAATPLHQALHVPRAVLGLARPGRLQR